MLSVGRAIARASQSQVTLLVCGGQGRTQVMGRLQAETPRGVSERLLAEEEKVQKQLAKQEEVSICCHKY